MTTVIITTDDYEGLVEWLGVSLSTGIIATAHVVPDTELGLLRPDGPRRER